MSVFLCLHLCMSRGQWEWWVCKRVTASSLYIVPPSSLWLSLEAVLKFQPNSSGQTFARSRLYLTATDNLETTKKSFSKTHFISLLLSNGLQGIQGHGNYCTEEGWHVRSGADAKVETDSWHVGSYSCQAWDTAQPLFKTLEIFSVPVGKVHLRQNKFALVVASVVLKGHSHTIFSSATVSTWRRQVASRGQFQPGNGTSNLDTTYLPVSFGLNVGYSRNAAVMTAFFLASGTSFSFYLSCFERWSFTLLALVKPVPKPDTTVMSVVFGMMKKLHIKDKWHLCL